MAQIVLGDLASLPISNRTAHNHQEHQTQGIQHLLLASEGSRYPQDAQTHILAKFPYA